MRALVTFHWLEISHQEAKFTCWLQLWASRHLQAVAYWLWGLSCPMGGLTNDIPQFLPPPLTQRATQLSGPIDVVPSIHHHVMWCGPWHLLPPLMPAPSLELQTLFPFASLDLWGRKKCFMSHHPQELYTLRCKCRRILFRGLSVCSKSLQNLVQKPKSWISLFGYMEMIIAKCWYLQNFPCNFHSKYKAPQL